MKIFWCLLVGVLGGTLGGMGMGGGTLLIPLLTLLSFTQKQAQAVNLVAFLPMAVVALCVHTKNGLVQYRAALPALFFGVCFSVVGALIAKALPNRFLRRAFGGFLLLLALRTFLQSKKQKQNFYAPEKGERRAEKAQEKEGENSP